MFAENNIQRIDDIELDEFREDILAFFKNSDPIIALQDLLNSLPYAAAILNSKRRAIYTNQSLLKNLGYDSVEELMGKRPGELLKCLHAINNNNPCGFSEHFKFWGALDAMQNTLTNNLTTINEMKLTSKKNGSIISSDLKVTVSPLMLQSRAYMILYLTDISDEKRRKVLEKIFFHDVLNKISSLIGYFDFVKSNYQSNFRSDFNEHFENMSFILNDLTDEILAQRQLTAAENNELKVKNDKFILHELIMRVTNQVRQLSNPKKINISVDPECTHLTVVSDAIILNRIITNMLKNAIEASDPGDDVYVKISNEMDSAIISIHNKAYIPHEIQLQIFQRSFSTKGENRGLGTYSIRLLAERYLKGKTFFMSSEEEGTTFYIRIPI